MPTVFRPIPAIRNHPRARPTDGSSIAATSRPPSRWRRSPSGVSPAPLRLAAAWALCLLLFAPARAQQPNPVYLDDSTLATETLLRINEFVASGNPAEAVHELQRLLLDHPDRLVSVPGQPGLFVSVRQRIHDFLLASPDLLERYRAAYGPQAEQELARGEAADLARIETSRLLTPAGLEAALRLAQRRFEAADFEAARLTLEQLERHPERRADLAAPARAADAARLYLENARYLEALSPSRPQVRQTAHRWLTEAGLDIPRDAPADVPEALRIPTANLAQPPEGPTAPFEPSGKGVPPAPLWTVPLDPPGAGPEGDERRERTHPSQPEDIHENSWIMPAVRADTVFINDGTWITARDRFTLEPRWVLRPDQDLPGDPWAARRWATQRGIGGQVEDTTSVTIGPRILIATTGFARDGAREGDPRTHAIEPLSGRILWSVRVPLLDPQLDSGSVRGPALIDGDTVILAVRKQGQGRRIDSLYLAGIALHSGQLRWVRLVASAGSLPWPNERRLPDALLLDRGIVFCADSLGVIGAFEAASGRPLWVRHAPAIAGESGGGSPAWQWGRPIADAGRIITLSPDRRELLVIDRSNGAILARRPAAEIGSPAYLLKVGPHLAAISLTRIAFLPLDDLAAAPRFGESLPAPGIRGRAVEVGGKVLLPRADGVAIIDPVNPRLELLVPLERPGTVLPLQSQLLVLSGANLHSHLTWAVAQTLLRERMAAEPDSPDHPITFAELAYRASHHDQIVPAVDAAIAVIERGATPQARAGRTRLFASLREMIHATQDRPPPEPRQPPAPPIPGRRRQPPALSPPPAPLPMLAQDHLQAVVERLGRIARTDDERVIHLIALGRAREDAADFREAAAAYQQVPADPALARATWSSGQARALSVRAEIEATARLRRLVLEHGLRIYAPFDLQAEREAAALGPRDGAEQFESLARRFPLARSAGAAWMSAAEAHQRDGRHHAAINALRQGLAAAETIHAAPSLTPAQLKDARIQLGEIAGRLVTRLRDQDQNFAAAHLLAQFRASHPQLPLLDHAVALDPEQLSRDLFERLAALDRFPRIGPRLSGDVQVLEGWTLMQPRSRALAGRASEHVMLISPSRATVGLWGVAASAPSNPGQSEPRAPDQLNLLWTRQYDGTPPVLLRLGPGAVYLFWEKHPDAPDEGAIVERIDAIDGRTRWLSQPFASLFPSDELFLRRIEAAGGRIDTPLDGQVRITDLLVVIDEQVLALIDRAGRAAAFDPSSGRLMWKAQTPITSVYDAATASGALVIGGAAAPAANPGALIGLRPAAIVYDARSGDTLHRHDQLAGPLRWVRAAGHGQGSSALLLGLEPEIVCIDLLKGATNWTLKGAPAFYSLDAWVFGPRLFLLDSQRTLWSAPLASGRLDEAPIDTYEHLAGRGAIHATFLGTAAAPLSGAAASGPGAGAGITAFATTQGVVLVDEEGSLVGIDALAAAAAGRGGGRGEAANLIIPALSQSYIVALQASPQSGQGPQAAYPLHLLDTRSAILRETIPLVLGAPPADVAVLDGRVLVTSGALTLIYAAPPADTPPQR